MNKFVNLDQLNASQLSQYNKEISKAFPKIISESQIIKNYWDRLETYFPEFQLFLLSNEGDLIGFMNAIPFQFKKPLDELPDNGWDWMFEKGILDYENNSSPNFLGGLQVIVKQEYQKSGYSKVILDHAKKIFKIAGFQNLIIPIRPTKKHLFPKMSMEAYLELKDQDKIYDPWIRTHLNGGAEIVKVCNHSMSMKGDVNFWENILEEKISKSGEFLLKGALSPISIDVKNNIGEYKEPNIWIKYD